jgi:hypothetical protein
LIRAADAPLFEGGDVARIVAHRLAPTSERAPRQTAGV